MGPASLARSFRYALRGLKWAWGEEPNFRRHLAAAVAAFWSARLLRLSCPEAALVGLAVTLVLAAELLNSALERLGDGSPRERPFAREAKDLAAAAVLVSAAGALLLGIFLFLPRLRADPLLPWRALRADPAGNALWAVVFLASAGLGWIFPLRRRRGRRGG